MQIVKSNVHHQYKNIMDIWRNEILFDAILDLLNHCLKKGFTFGECLKCASYLYESIDQIKKSESESMRKSAQLNLPGLTHFG